MSSGPGQRVVLDASILVEYLLVRPSGRRLEPLLLDAGVELHVPALCDCEVAAVLRRALLGRRLGAERAYDALEDYLELPLTRHGHTYLLGRMLGLRHAFSSYDATYVALCEWLQAKLLTADQALARAVREQTDVPLL